MKPGIRCEQERTLSLPAQHDMLPVLVVRQLSCTRVQYDGRGTVRAADHDYSLWIRARPSTGESGGQMRKRFRSMGAVPQGRPGAYAADAEHTDDARCEQSV